MEVKGRSYMALFRTFPRVTLNIHVLSLQFTLILMLQLKHSIDLKLCVKEDCTT